MRPSMENKKYVVVTGASGGLGSATVSYLLEQGYFVIGVDIKDRDVKHDNYVFFKHDLTLPTHIESFKQEIINLGVKLYAIIHLLGMFKMSSVVEGDENELRKIFDINFFIAFNLNQELIPYIEPNGRIIIVSSELARYSPQPFNGYYAVSKHTVDTYADVLRRECAYIGIKVVKVQCGSFKTKLLNGVNPEYKRMKDQTQYFDKPLTKMKFLMDNELNKGNNPILLAKLMDKILKKKKPKILYKIKNSGVLSFLNFLPERMQDFIYKKAIK